MNRNYDRKHYLNLVNKIKLLIPDASLSTDIITGFPTETEEDHRQTLEVMKEVQFDGSFMFKYSPRENTHSYKMADNVPDEIKTRRINEIVELQTKISFMKNSSHIEKTLEVLVEGESKKSPSKWQGRTDGNKMVIFPKGNFLVGTYIKVNIERANSATLFGFLTHSNTQTAEKAA